MQSTSPRREPVGDSNANRSDGPDLQSRRSEVVGLDSPLVAGATYTWEELGARFDFGPDYLGAAGGMVSRPEQNALMLVTHPGGAPA
jgi:hypothetical protein